MISNGFSYIFYIEIYIGGFTKLREKSAQLNNWINCKKEKW